MLDNRLKMCAEMVSGSGIVCDVGTDHAYLAAELILSGKCSKVIAADVKEGPLAAAAKTVKKYGIDDKVDLVLSDGLKNVPCDGVSDIVIAGMGGETIAEIIGEIIYGRFDNCRFILQPMSKVDFLRKELYKYEFEITEERVAEDGDKLYVVMCARHCDYYLNLTETEALYGFFDEADELTVKYRKAESERLKKIGDKLEKADKHDEAVHYSALSRKISEGTASVSVKEIYDYLDELYPFGLQEKWDNSGLLVEDWDAECSKVLLALDITNQVALEAYWKETQLIISHHPVIFDPLKKITKSSPVYRLVNSGIAALCMHTNLDIAAGGTNGVILKKLKEKLDIQSVEPFEAIGEESLGFVCELAEKVKIADFGKILKEIFGCEYIRTARCKRPLIKRFAVCSGSGGSLLGLALDKECDAFVTGDVKHDVWIEANNHSISLFDCGHFHTENLVLWELRRVLEEKFPQLDIEIAERNLDPCLYI